MKPEKIGGDVERELSRFGPAAGMMEIVRAWPSVVGEQIAQNAWPARIARDGKLHVATSSSAWAFELAQLEPKLLERFAKELGDSTPSGFRFAPGKLPETSFDADSAAAKRGRAPTAEEQRHGEEIAGEIEDESLRKIVAKAAAASLARPS